VLGFFLSLLVLAWATAARLLLGLFLAFVVALTVAIQAKADGQAEDFAGCPGRQADDEGDHDPDVSPTDEFNFLAGEKGIVMHANAEKIKAAFATEGVVQGQHEDSVGREGVDEQGSDGHGQGIERPDIMTEEAMEARPVSLADVVAGIDEFGDIAMSHRKNPAGHERTEQKEEIG